MKSYARQLPSSFAKLFGFFIVALVLADGSCRFHRVKAQEEGLTMKNFCTEEHLRFLYGDDWHIYYAINLCWLYEPTPTATFAKRPRLVMRGR